MDPVITCGYRFVGQILVLCACIFYRVSDNMKQTLMKLLSHYSPHEIKAPLWYSYRV